jgi:hypothetical protein
MAVGQIAKMVASLVSPHGGIEKIVLKKLESLGGDFILQQLGMSGGSLDIFDDLKFLKVKPLGLGFSKMAQPGQMAKRLQKQFLQAGKKKSFRRSSKWSRSEWASSREDWLGNQWKHDWRSQPRNALGKWIPGRLSAIESQLQYKGKKAGRRTKRRRRLRRAARLRGRKMAKMAFRR